ncbi:hypothetical protein RCCS2_14519 [Roseobacter sp. CCS2]|nr:hypothetical protein RCCS2_14519 [Roseobacter sp. CCS2]
MAPSFAQKERGRAVLFAQQDVWFAKVFISFPIVMLCLFYISILDIWGTDAHNENEYF